MNKSLALGAVLCAVLLPMAPAHAATAGSADGVGYVRLAHLSPDTPEVDVYLNSQSGAVAEQIFRGVGYGVMSNYMTLPAGGYSVAMRGKGAPASEPPVLTTQVSVDSGGAYTVAGVGKYAELGLKVLRDDLALPAENKAKVRIVQASVGAPVLNVSVANGPAIADNVAFATTTEYRLVDPGTWNLVVRPANGTASTELTSTLAPGNVYSLLILDAQPSGLKTEVRVDARRTGEIPEGGVQTGAGGTRLIELWWVPASAVLIVLFVWFAWRVRARLSS